MSRNRRRIDAGIDTKITRKQAARQIIVYIDLGQISQLSYLRSRPFVWSEMNLSPTDKLKSHSYTDTRPHRHTEILI